MNFLFFILLSFAYFCLAAEHGSSRNDLLEKLMCFETLGKNAFKNARPAILQTLHELSGFPKVPGNLDVLDSLVYKFVLSGDIEALTMFEQAGFTEWRELICPSFHITPVKANKYEVLAFLAERGLDMVLAAPDLACSLGDLQLTPSQFDFLLQKGLPLDPQRSRTHRLDFALLNKNTDLAHFQYNKGLRCGCDAALSTFHDYASTKSGLLITMAVERINLLLAGTEPENSDHREVPRETITKEIASKLYLLYQQDIDNPTQGSITD